MTDYPFFRYGDPLPSYWSQPNRWYKDLLSRYSTPKNACGNDDCPICNEEREANIRKAELELGKAMRELLEKQLTSKYVYSNIFKTPAEVEAVEEETLDIQEVIDDLRGIRETLTYRTFVNQNPDATASVRDMAFAIGQSDAKLRQLILDLKSWLPETKEGE